MERWTIKELKEISDKDFAICILQERLSGLSNPYSPLAEKLKGTIGKLRETNLNEAGTDADNAVPETKDKTIAAKVMRVVDRIESSDYPEGLLGFCIEDQIDSYEEVEERVLDTFKKHPQQADILEEMLIAICGWGMESLKERMEENADYYNSLA